MTRWTKHHQDRRNEYKAWIDSISSNTLSLADLERALKATREMPHEPPCFIVPPEIIERLNKFYS